MSESTQGNLFYPRVAGWKGQETSRAAAQSTKADKLKALVIETLRTYGPMTPDETAAMCAHDKLSIRPRFSELRELGWIKDTGERRKNESSGKRAIVWGLT